MKCNIDGAQRCSWFRGGGGVFRDRQGRVLDCFLCLLCNKLAYMAEVETIICALDFVIEKGWSHIWLECDSMYIVNLIFSSFE